MLLAETIIETTIIFHVSNFDWIEVKWKLEYITRCFLQIQIKITNSRLKISVSLISSSLHHPFSDRLKTNLLYLNCCYLYQIFAKCTSLTSMNLPTARWPYNGYPIPAKFTLEVLKETSFCETVERIDLIHCYMHRFLLSCSALLDIHIFHSNLHN